MERARTGRGDVEPVIPPATMDGLATGIMVSDRFGKIVWINHALEEFFGIKRKDALGADRRRLIQDQITDKLAESGVFLEKMLASCDAGDTIRGFECHVLGSATRQEQWFEACSTPITTGSLAGGRLDTYQDATSVKTMEKALQESRSLLRALVDRAADAVLIHDASGRILDVNANACTSLGYPRKELLILPIDVIDREYAAYIRSKEMAGRLKGVQPVRYAGQQRRKDGTSFPVEIHVSLMEYQGQPAMVSVVRDVSERLRAGAALQREREFTQEILQTLASLVVVLDTEGRIVRFNRACEETTGYTAEEILGKTIWNTLLLTEEIEGIRDVFKSLRAGMFPNEFENHWVAKDGRPRLIAWSNTAILDESGDVAYIVGTGLDVTQRRNQEKEQSDLEAKMQQAQKLESLGIMAGGIAHDFNNLLTAISGNADLALTQLESDSPAATTINEIEDVVARAADLTRQMLAYSGKGKFVIEPLSLTDAVREIAGMLEIAISKKVRVSYDLLDPLPAVEADATQIRQVIMNLITNASEAIGEDSGVISIRTRVVECDRPYLEGCSLVGDLAEGSYVCLEVADTGCGMSDETIGKLFDPFFTTKFTGRGLGMAAVQGIMHGHQGAILVTSEVGRGTTFRLLFPASEASVVLTSNGDTNQGEWRGQGTVLLVDDEAPIRSVTRKMLERLGFDVIVADDGLEALNLFISHQDEITCVLLDLTMPNMGGEECFESIRRVKADASIILSSGYNEAEATSAFAGKGLAGFVQKPYRLSNLAAALKSALSRR